MELKRNQYIFARPFEKTLAVCVDELLSNKKIKEGESSRSSAMPHKVITSTSKIAARESWDAELLHIGAF